MLSQRICYAKCYLADGNFSPVKSVGSHVFDTYDVERSFIQRLRAIAKQTAFDKIAELYARSTGKPIEDVMRDVERDFYMTAEDARAYGLIDRILDRESRVSAA